MQRKLTVIVVASALLCITFLSVNADGPILFLPAIFSSSSSPADSPAPVPKTGAGTISGYSPVDGEDGLLQKGVAWPNPRFTDNGNGAVTDNLTGLIWLRNASCFGQEVWAAALTSANTLNSGECGLTDGSVEGDWRLPNRFELESLLHLGFRSPALPNTVGTGQWSEGDPFSGVHTDDVYWTSTTGYPAFAWIVGPVDGFVSQHHKQKSARFVWPVRGGLVLFSSSSSPADSPAPVPKTGAGTISGYSPVDGEDGLLQKGVAWPNPRFTDNGNGAVTDNLTGLIWLRNASCFGQEVWAAALTSANTLNSGECGLTDGSVEGDWRLPNRFELESLLHLGFSLPALPNTVGTGQWSEGDPFSGVHTDDVYWTSTTHTFIGPPSAAWSVGMRTGSVLADNKMGGFYVWPVRGGQ